jgi:hypothetical protein
MDRRITASLAVAGLLAVPSVGMAKTHRAFTPRQLAAARREVRIAKADGTLKQLSSLVMRRSARAADTTTAAGPDASQQALAVALYQEGSSAGQVTGAAPAVAAPGGAAAATFGSDVRARSASACWGTISSDWWHTIAGGAIVARVNKYNYGWCGTGSRITSGEYNFNHYFWAQYPYCLTNESNNQGWDGTSYDWAHGGAWATTGVYTVALVCVPILGGEHATLRIAGNGYWDRYDDYGY